MRAATSERGASAQGETGRKDTLMGPVTPVTRTESGAAGRSGAAMQQFSDEVEAGRRPSGQQSWQLSGGAGAIQADADCELMTRHRPITSTRTTQKPRTRVTGLCYSYFTMCRRSWRLWAQRTLPSALMIMSSSCAIRTG